MGKLNILKNTEYLDKVIKRCNKYGFVSLEGHIDWLSKRDVSKLEQFLSIIIEYNNYTLKSNTHNYILEYDTDVYLWFQRFVGPDTFIEISLQSSEKIKDIDRVCIVTLKELIEHIEMKERLTREFKASVEEVKTKGYNTDLMKDIIRGIWRD